MFLLLLSLLALASLWLLVFRRHPPGFPPGPRAPLPLVGDLAAVGNDLTEGFEALARKYGDVVGFYLGHRRTVLLSSPELIVESMTMEQLSNRPTFEDFLTVRGTPDKDATGIPGIIGSSGHSWVEQRRFALRTLRDFGMGKTGMEELVEEEVEDLCQRLEKENGELLEMKSFFNRSALKALHRVLTNEDCDLDNSPLPRFWKRMEVVTEFSNKAITQLSIQYPFLNRVIMWMGKDTFSTVHVEFSKLVSEIVEKHRETFQEDDPRDFTDLYLKQMRENADNPGSSFHGRDGELNIKGVLGDLIQAGTDTISNTLSWAMLFMAKNPDVQKKVQEELDEKIGRSRFPSWGDRSSLPYTEAALLEVQRLGNLTPFGVPRDVSEDIRLGGFLIPKGTAVFPLLGMVMNSPRWFPEPSRFDPERYLSKTEDGGLRFEPSPHVMPFGYGRRRCAGETLARMELYRYVTGVLHRFKVEPPPGDTLDHVKSSLGAISTPSSFKVRFSPRAE